MSNQMNATEQELALAKILFSAAFRNGNWETDAVPKYWLDIATTAIAFLAKPAPVAPAPVETPGQGFAKTFFVELGADKEPQLHGRLSKLYDAATAKAREVLKEFVGKEGVYGAMAKAALADLELRGEAKS